MTHQTEVRPGSVGTIAYQRAACLTCSWKGPHRDSEREAMHDTDGHRNDPLVAQIDELREALGAMRTQVASLLEYGPTLSPMVRATFEKCLRTADEALD